MSAERFVIALLGQPNSGKSTLFNALTGSRQRVGNWPGKTVEKREGVFQHGGKSCAVVDLPGSYSLSAGSDEEMVTRDYIAGGEADLVCILADASQLERSLYMLADFAGINTPVILLLNMIDVAKEKGKTINAKLLEERLGIPVIPFAASNRKEYGAFYAAVENAQNQQRRLLTGDLNRLYEDSDDAALKTVGGFVPENGIGRYAHLWLCVKVMEGDAPAVAMVEDALPGERRADFSQLVSRISSGNLVTGDCKFRWIDTLLSGAVQNRKTSSAPLGRFDRAATSKRWGKPIAIGIIILGLVGSMIPFLPVTILAKLIPALLGPPLGSFLNGAGVAPFLTALVTEGLLNTLQFSFMMASFVFGVTFVFGFLEDVGYMARISFVFDGLMNRLGLQGKAMMPFVVSLGCTIGGAAGTRVIDSWGQRALAMAILWAVPCGAVLSIIPTLASVFFGWGAALVMLGIVAMMVLHMMITAKVFGPALVPEKERHGMIMELPPYHKAKWGNIFRATVARSKDIFLRAFKVIFVVTVVFFCLTWTADGNVTNSVIYKIGAFIEPVTRFFGLGWRTFMAFIAAGIAKEAVLGVLNALYMGGGSVFVSTISKSPTAVTENFNAVLSASISRPEALAFIFAVSFTVPCMIAMASTYSENRSLKWTLKIAAYYMGTALLLSALVFHVSSLFM